MRQLGMPPMTFRSFGAESGNLLGSVTSAPHGLVSHGQYVVPTGKVAVLNSVALGFDRVTVAAPVGVVRFYGRLRKAAGGGSDIVHVVSIGNLVGSHMHRSFGCACILFGGDTIETASEDLSIGGTVRFDFGFWYTLYQA